MAAPSAQPPASTLQQLLQNPEPASQPPQYPLPAVQAALMAQPSMVLPTVPNSPTLPSQLQQNPLPPAPPTLSVQPSLSLPPVSSLPSIPIPPVGSLLPEPGVSAQYVQSVAQEMDQVEKEMHQFQVDDGLVTEHGTHGNSAAAAMPGSFAAASNHNSVRHHSRHRHGKR